MRVRRRIKRCRSINKQVLPSGIVWPANISFGAVTRCNMGGQLNCRVGMKANERQIIITQVLIYFTLLSFPILTSLILIQRSPVRILEKCHFSTRQHLNFRTVVLASPKDPHSLKVDKL